MTTQKNTRPVFKYDPVECELGDIRKGDIFAMGPRDDGDEILNVGGRHDVPRNILDHGFELMIAQTDAKPIAGDAPTNSTHELVAGRLIADRYFGRNRRERFMIWVRDLPLVLRGKG